MMIGKKAKATCQKILDGGTNDMHEWNPPYNTGYFFEPDVNMWTTFDNSTKDMWMENFENEQDAIDWCEGKIEGD